MNKDQPESERADDLEALQGTWQQVGCNMDGVPDPAEEYGAKPYLIITGSDFVVTKQDGTMAIKGRFELDPAQTPKTIDWMDTFGADAGMTIPAIYFFDSGRFVFCAASEGSARPANFDSGPGQLIRIHERVRS